VTKLFRDETELKKVLIVPVKAVMLELYCIFLAKMALS